MQKYTFKIVLRVDRAKKDGTAPMILQAFLAGDRVRIPLNLWVKPEEFDELRMQVRIKGETTKTQKMNAILAKVKSRVEDMFFECLINDTTLSASAFEEQFDRAPVQGNFLLWLEQEIDKERDDKEATTIRGYQSMLAALKMFREKVAFADVTFEFIQEWDRWLKKKKKIDHNTVATYHRRLRKFVRLAIKKKKRIANPYLDFKFSEIHTERTYLTAEEVLCLHDLYKNADMRPFMRDTLRHFLFQIGTSLRYSDLKRMEKTDIIDGMLVFVPLKTKRTGKLVKVPLSDLARQMLADRETHGNTLFKVPAEQIMNRRLREIQELAGLAKGITSHVGRHTYGYLFIAAGGTVEVLQKIMGHADIKTTMIYTHIDARQIRGGVEQLNTMLAIPKTV